MILHFARIDFTTIEDLKLNRLEAEVQTDNTASLRLAKKAGMKKETLRKQAVYFEKKWHDHLVYCITAKDLGLKNRKPVIR